MHKFLDQLSVHDEKFTTKVIKYDNNGKKEITKARKKSFQKLLSDLWRYFKTKRAALRAEVSKENL